MEIHKENWVTALGIALVIFVLRKQSRAWFVNRQHWKAVHQYCERIITVVGDLKNEQRTSESIDAAQTRYAKAQEQYVWGAYCCCARRLNSLNSPAVRTAPTRSGSSWWRTSQISRIVSAGSFASCALHGNCEPGGIAVAVWLSPRTDSSLTTSRRAGIRFISRRCRTYGVLCLSSGAHGTNTR